MLRCRYYVLDLFLIATRLFPPGQKRVNIAHYFVTLAGNAKSIQDVFPPGPRPKVKSTTDDQSLDRIPLWPVNPARCWFCLMRSEVFRPLLLFFPGEYSVTLRGLEVTQAYIVSTSTDSKVGVISSKARPFNTSNFVRKENKRIDSLQQQAIDTQPS